MHILVEGSGGRSGWPEPGCRCASCLRSYTDGNVRKRSTIVVNGALRLGCGGTGRTGGGEVAGDTGGFLVRRLGDARGATGLGGWDVTCPGGERLLYPGGPGAVPEPGHGAEPYDVAFLDMLGDPAQLGGLRARGLVRADTIAVVAFADHRVPAGAELERRARFWRVSVLGDGEAISTERSAEGVEARGVDDVRRGPWRVLVMGGARSGKSERAELRLAGESDVTYVATGPRVFGDDGFDGTRDLDWAARVAAHRARRPRWWRTAETTDLAGVLEAARGAVLIDGIGTWLTAVMDECEAWNSADGAHGAHGVSGVSGFGGKVADRLAELVAAWRQTEAFVVAVSDETGMGVVPSTSAGRLFRDELGRLNQILAAESEETELVVAGRVVPLTNG